MHCYRYHYSLCLIVPAPPYPKLGYPGAAAADHSGGIYREINPLINIHLQTTTYHIYQ